MSPKIVATLQAATVLLKQSRVFNISFEKVEHKSISKLADSSFNAVTEDVIIYQGFYEHDEVDALTTEISEFTKSCE